MEKKKKSIERPKNLQPIGLEGKGRSIPVCEGKKTHKKLK